MFRAPAGTVAPGAGTRAFQVGFCTLIGGGHACTPTRVMSVMPITEASASSMPSGPTSDTDLIVAGWEEVLF